MNIIEIIKEYKLFVDTCSLMHESSNTFFNDLASYLTEYKKKVIVPDKVIYEIKGLQKNKKIRTSNAACKGAKILDFYKENNIIEIRGEKGDPFADNVFHYVFSKFRTQYNLALITQDKGLAIDILDLKKSKAIQSSKKLLVLKLDKNGKIKGWNDDIIITKIKPQNKFNKYLKPRTLKKQILKATITPMEGNYIIANNKRIHLNKLIGEGGEGKIYLTDSGEACKIYLENKLTENRLEKITLMIKKNIKIIGVCWPTAIAYNTNNEFVGYLMPRAEGKPMQKCMFVKPLLEKNFQNWTRKNIVQLAICWLEIVCQLHDLDILIGDINPLNFLIKSDKEIYFVDTDSYQIEDFPCPVGMANFTAPEIQGKKYDSFLRTPENEFFAIATQLFMILLPGKPPYSHCGGTNAIKNIKSGNFSYPLGDASTQKTPDGPWRFIWSHFPFKTKEAFFNCFTENQKRITPIEWLDLITAYKHDLEHGYLDPSGESNKIFPTRFKEISEYAKKKYELPDVNNEKKVSLKCSLCGKTFQTNANKAKKSNEKICYDCHKIKKLERTTGQTISCSECGNAFLFSISEENFFKEKGYSKPKRCKECRSSKPEINYQKSNIFENSIWDIIKDIINCIFN